MSHTLIGLPLPVTLRPAIVLADEELMRSFEQNKPYEIERNREGEITVMTPVGGIGSTHYTYIANALYQWNESVMIGWAFISNAGFSLRDDSCLSPDAA